MTWAPVMRDVGGAAAIALLATALLLLVPGTRAQRDGPFAFSVVFFLALTQIPLPDPATLACPIPDTEPLLEPFRFMRLFWERWTADSMGVAVRSGLNVPAALFNLVVFIAIGWAAGPVLRSPRRIVAFGALLSLTVELTQLTGTWGIYPCPYRQFDVDDLILNTLGAAVGAFVWMALRSER